MSPQSEPHVSGAAIGLWAAVDIVEQMAVEWPADEQRLRQASNRIRCAARLSCKGTSGAADADDARQTIRNLTAQLDAANATIADLRAQIAQRGGQEAGEAITALEAHEAWEADIILNADWGAAGMCPFPTLTQYQMSALSVVQDKRNIALRSLRAALAARPATQDAVMAAQPGSAT